MNWSGSIDVDVEDFQRINEDQLSRLISGARDWEIVKHNK